MFLAIFSFANLINAMSKEGRSTECNFAHVQKEIDEIRKEDLIRAKYASINFLKIILTNYSKKQRLAQRTDSTSTTQTKGKEYDGLGQLDSINTNIPRPFEANSSTESENKSVCKENYDFFSRFNSECLYLCDKASNLLNMPKEDIKFEKKKDQLIFIHNIINATIFKLKTFISKKEFSYLIGGSCNEHENAIISEVCKELLDFLDFLNNDSLNNIKDILNFLEKLRKFFSPIDSIFCFKEPITLNKWVRDINLQIYEFYVVTKILYVAKPTLNIIALSFCVEIAELVTFEKK